MLRDTLLTSTWKHTPCLPIHGPLGAAGPEAAASLASIMIRLCLPAAVFPKQCKIGPRFLWSVTESRIRAFDWYQNQRAWLNLN